MISFWSENQPAMAKPLEQMLNDREPNINFCLMWAHGSTRERCRHDTYMLIIFEATLLCSTAAFYTRPVLVTSHLIAMRHRRWDGLNGPHGLATYRKQSWNAHWQWMLRFFMQDKYITVNGKPMLLVHGSSEVEDYEDLLIFWRKAAAEAGVRCSCYRSLCYFANPQINCGRSIAVASHV